MVLADDNQEMLAETSRLLAANAGFDILGTAFDGAELITAATTLGPQVAIVDISMPVINGLAAAAEVLRLAKDVRVVFLTVHEDPDFVSAALETGALGYVVKRRMATDLVPAMKEALAGRVFISEGCELKPEA